VRGSAAITAASDTKSRSLSSSRSGTPMARNVDRCLASRGPQRGWDWGVGGGAARSRSPKHQLRVVPPPFFLDNNGA